jgi:hypothetical protein
LHTEYNQKAEILRLLPSIAQDIEGLSKDMPLPGELATKLAEYV